MDVQLDNTNMKKQYQEITIVCIFNTPRLDVEASEEEEWHQKGRGQNHGGIRVLCHARYHHSCAETILEGLKFLALKLDIYT